MQMVLPLPRSVTGATGCAIDGCDRDYKASGYCGKHYLAWKNHGDPLAPSRRSIGKYPPDAICEVESCDKPRMQRTFCVAHGERWKKYGDPLAGGAPKVAGGARCTAIGCDSRAFSNGYCPKHLQRFQKYGTPYITSSSGRHESSFPKVCRVMSCPKWQKAHGYCAMHEQRMRFRGTLSDPVRPIVECNWPGCEQLQTAKYCKRHGKHRSTQTRRAHKKSAKTIPYTLEQLAAKLAYWGNKCWMCGGPFEAVDHVKPLSKGGYDCLANYRPACGSCNSRKHNKWFGVSELHRFLKT